MEKDDVEFDPLFRELRKRVETSLPFSMWELDHGRVRFVRDTLEGRRYVFETSYLLLIYSLHKAGVDRIIEEVKIQLELT